MSNIGWDRVKINRVINTPPGTITDFQISEEEKHPYVPAMKITNEMSAGQKETVKFFNSMRKFLLDHDLMQQKSGGA